VKLRGAKLLLWRKDLKRKKGVPAMAPDLAFVSRYVCTGCEKVFYYKYGDAETPQYVSRKNYKPPKGSIFGKSDAYCHRCWHRNDFTSRTSESGCWLCDLRKARVDNLRDKKEIDGLPIYRKNGWSQSVSEAQSAPPSTNAPRKRSKKVRRAIVHV
jgi:hypothetical protein